MLMPIRDSEYNLIDHIEKSKTLLRAESERVERDTIYRVTPNCLRNMMQYCDWMPVHFFPTGFLFSVLPHPDAPDNTRFKVDGWVVTADKTLGLVTLIVGDDGAL